jgi:3-keto-5-aminohexanoate cleavage enzyme
MANENDSSWSYTSSYAFMERVRLGMPPVIICCACNGGVQGKESNASIPETADEIGDSVYAAYKAGASMVHVHARDPHNLAVHAKTTEIWHEVNKKIRETCPSIIINNTTGGGPNMTMEERLSCLDARPEMASLNLAPDMSKFKVKARKPPLKHPHPEQQFDECVAFTYGQISAWAGEMKKRGIKPEMEVYHSGCAWVVNDLIHQEVIEKPYWIQTVMGYQTSSYPTVKNVLDLVTEFPEGAMWLCSGIGAFQLPLTTLAALMGGHVRVGLEDNIYYRRGEKAKSNAQLVERAARIVNALGRDVATPAQARKMLGLSETPSEYTG